MLELELEQQKQLTTDTESKLTHSESRVVQLQSMEAQMEAM